MTTKTTQHVGVKIITMVNASYECTDVESVHSKFPDIYFPCQEDSDERSDLGSDFHHYSITGDSKDEMVIVDKGLLEALVDQCQRLSSNEAVYNDTKKTSFNYADLNKLVAGMTFPAEVTNHKG